MLQETLMALSLVSSFISFHVIALVTPIHTPSFIYHIITLVIYLSHSHSMFTYYVILTFINPTNVASIE